MNCGRVVRDLVARVERPDGPDDGLAGVGEHGAVQLVGCLQRALVRHDAVAVHQRRVQQTDRVRVLLRGEITSTLVIAGRYYHSTSKLCSASMFPLL